MFITDSLRAEVKGHLRQMGRYAAWLETFAAAKKQTVTTTDEFAAERALHIAVECAVDAANLIIDALVMREPGGYADILRVLMEEHVVSHEWFEAFEGALEFRNRLVHNYNEIRHEEVMAAVERYHGLFVPFANSLEKYLQMAS